MAKEERKRRASEKAPTPPQPKPWDVAPPPAEGDAEKETVFAAVGSALSAWESLEGQLSQIFGGLVCPEQDSLAAQRAYGSVLTSRGRGEMVIAAADAVFFLFPNDALQKSLSELVREIGKFAARRNEIAHGKIKSYSVKAGVFFRSHGHTTRPSGYVLGPPDYATNKTSLEEGHVVLVPVRHVHSYAYSSVEIAAFQEHFERLEKAARDVSVNLWRHQSASRKPKL